MTGTYSTSHLGAAKAASYDWDFSEGFLGRFWHQVERPHLLALLDDVRPQGLHDTEHLDVACGTGRILAALDGHTGHSTGVDISPDMLEIAREKVPAATIRVSDVANLNEHQRYHLVTAFRFFLNAEDSLRRAALRSIFEALRPGGLLVANVHASPWSVVGVVRQVRRHLGLPVDNTMRHGDFIDLLGGAGLDIVGSRTYGFMPISNKINHASTQSLLCRGDRLATQLLPSHSPLASTLLVAAQKPAHSDAKGDPDLEQR